VMPVRLPTREPHASAKRLLGGDRLSNHGGRSGVAVVFGDTTTVINADGSETVGQEIIENLPAHLRFEVWYNRGSSPLKQT
jgi:ABC-type antimicrobial peptide transport system ATPase subunit